MDQSPCVIPTALQVKNGKHYASNCYSITIRDGCGVDLGSKPHNDFVAWIKATALFHVISIEKSGKAAHFQVGMILPSPLRQDSIRSQIMNLYEPLNWNENQKKHAVKVIHHNDVRILFLYCIKEVNPISFNYPISVERLRGCQCPDRYEMAICRHCDPNRNFFQGDPILRLRWKLLWSKTEDDPEKFFLSLDDPLYKDLVDYYSIGYFPWVNKYQ